MKTRDGLRLTVKVNISAHLPQGWAWCYNINKYKSLQIEMSGIMKLVDQTITNKELKEMSTKMFDSIVKAVIDIDKEVMVVDAEMHADQEDYLLQLGSEQKYLWGINIYPDQVGTENWIEFDSMINLRPSQNNRSRDIEDPGIREKIKVMVDKLVSK